jgi:hypothetical protein
MGRRKGMRQSREQTVIQKSMQKFVLVALVASAAGQVVPGVTTTVLPGVTTTVLAPVAPLVPTSAVPSLPMLKESDLTTGQVCTNKMIRIPLMLLLSPFPPFVSSALCLSSTTYSCYFYRFTLLLRISSAQLSSSPLTLFVQI